MERGHFLFGRPAGRQAGGRCVEADFSAIKPDGVLARFLASTGPAAIATLFVASLLPMLKGGVPLPLVIGTASVLTVYAALRSVVLATLAGSVGYGLAVWLLSRDEL